MRDFYRLAASSLLIAVACNEALGLEPGKPGSFGGSGGVGGSPDVGGVSGDSGESGSGVGAEPSGGQPTQGGSRATGGSAGSREGGTAGSNRGGTGIGDGGASGAGPDACSSATDCKDRGFDWPYVCQSGRCIDITTDDCDTVLGAEWLESSPEVEPFILGAYYGFDTANIEAELFYWIVKLAMKEFNDYGAIPIAGVDRRPLALLCHRRPGESDFGPVYRSLDHMIETVGVSGILMFTSRAELLTAAERTFNDRHEDVFMIDFAGANGQLLGVEDQGLLWHMLGDPSLISLIYAPLVERVEEHVNPGASRGESTRPTRLVMLTPPSINGFWEYVSPEAAAKLRINGTLASEQPENFRNLPALVGPLENLAEQVAEFAPDIVVDFSRGVPMRNLIDEAVRNRSRTPPFYVLAPPNPPLDEEVSADSSLRQRLVGVNYASAEDARLYDAYNSRLRAIAPEGMDILGLENVYDPMYFLLYAAVAGGVGGHNMKNGMERLITGVRRFDMGPDGIQSVLARLSNANATLKLYGTLGAPEFHRPTGGRYAGASVWCINENLDYEFDVLRFDFTDLQARELYGTFPCFDF